MGRILLVILPLAFVACGSAPEDIHETRFMMGTVVEFSIHGSARPQALAAINAAAEEMQRVERVFTIEEKQTNAVKAFNTLPVNMPAQLPEEVEQLLTQALDIARASNDAFTPAIGSLSELWGFNRLPSPASPPSTPSVKHALAGVSSNHIQHTDKGWIRNHSLTQLDFSGIAKGYAIDKGIEVLQSHGIEHAIINAGGDMRVIGTRGNRPWKIGIRHPRKPDEIIGWVQVKGDISIVTSGDYERYFMHNSKRLHHILNPATGMPAEQSMSATVVSDSASKADGWSTAMFILGTETGMPLAENIEDIEVLWVDHAGKLHVSSKMQNLFHKQL